MQNIISTIASAPAGLVDGASRNHRIAVSRGMSGYFAVMMAEFYCAAMDDWTWEPWNSGFGRYDTTEPAMAEGRVWAEQEDIPFLNPITRALENCQKGASDTCEGSASLD
jgi:hypothetical protein